VLWEFVVQNLEAKAFFSTRGKRVKKKEKFYLPVLISSSSEVTFYLFWRKIEFFFLLFLSVLDSIGMKTDGKDIIDFP